MCTYVIAMLQYVTLISYSGCMLSYHKHWHCILFIVLYYAMLCYSILCYTMLYYAILYYAILCYTILYYTILYYTILYYNAVQCMQLVVGCS